MSETKFAKTLPHLVPILFLMSATFAVFGQTLGYDYIFNWDDNVYVFENQALIDFSLFRIKLALTNYYGGNYAPIQIFSYMMDRFIWGFNPQGYHLTNLIIHAMNGVLFYKLLFRWSENRFWAFAASFLFLVHPVQVESVAWISQRKNLLAMLFFLIAFAAWQNYRERISVSWYMTSLIAFFIAILSKSVAVIFPLILLIYECRSITKDNRHNILKSIIPFFAIALFGAVLTLISQAPENLGGRVSFHSNSPIDIMFTMTTVLAKYFCMLFWPTQLSAIYSNSIKTTIDGEVFICLIFLAILIFIGILLWKHRHEAVFWYSLFFLGLLPVSQIIPLVTLMNDRYLYFPMLGAAPLIVWPLRNTKIDPATRRVTAILLTIPILLFALSAWQRTNVWRTATTLWTDAVYKFPSEKIAWGYMIESYVHDENLKEIPASLINNPQFRKGMEVPVMQFLSKNDTFNAYRILDQLEAAYPNYAEVWYLEGLVSINKGETDKAQEMFWHALTLDPKFSKAYFALGNISLESHDYTKATSFYTQAEVAGGPERIIASNQAVAAVMTGNLSVAKQHLERAFHAGMKDCEAFTAKDEFKAIKSRPEFKTLFSVCQEMEKVQ